jgi:hypothetical protein
MIKGAGRMGWKADDFWFCTPSYFYAAYNGHLEQERDRFHQQLAAARIVAYYAIAPHLDKGKSLSFSDIVKLPGDEKEAVFPELTKEQIEEFSRKADRGFKQHTGKEWPA